jgi:probable phosphoglycerate mutase
VSRLLLIRHGATAWNEAGRIQGRSDPGLSPAGRAAVARWALPDGAAWAAGARWLCSPLRRARETATLLHDGTLIEEPRLAEMDWGAWEGRTLADLRDEFGAGMTANEGRGLDFRPPGGESPRDVQRRLRPLLAELAATGAATVAVTHKGVIRAAYALASGWDLTGRPPAKLRDGCAHAFILDPGGTPRVAALNLQLDAACQEL